MQNYSFSVVLDAQSACTMYSERALAIDEPFVLRRCAWHQKGGSGTTFEFAWECVSDDNIVRLQDDLNFRHPNYAGNQSRARLHTGETQEFFPYTPYPRNHNHLWVHGYTVTFSARSWLEATFDITEMRAREMELYLRGEISIPGHTRQ